MARFPKLNPFSFILRKSADFAISLLTKPIARYQLAIPNDIAQLKRNLRRGDVVLIEGNERISECIKYLTQSSWSHSALFVGDEPLKRDPALRQELTEKYGDNANYLLVEALVESGVVLTPIGKYRDFNVRICRPHNLTATDQREVVEYALSRVGRHYDFKNVFDLARYFLPVHLVPAKLRRQALHFGSGDPTRVICSSLIAESFARVKFPVVPRYEPFPPGFEPVRRMVGFLGRFSRAGSHVPGLLRMVSPTLITPRDFDLSPYFEIIKFNLSEHSKFDYRKLIWFEEPDSGAQKLERSA
jgi:hypothetical protein